MPYRELSLRRCKAEGASSVSSVEAKLRTLYTPEQAIELVKHKLATSTCKKHDKVTAPVSVSAKPKKVLTEPKHAKKTTKPKPTQKALFVYPLEKRKPKPVGGSDAPPITAHLRYWWRDEMKKGGSIYPTAQAGIYGSNRRH